MSALRMAGCCCSSSVGHFPLRSSSAARRRFGPSVPVIVQFGRTARSSTPTATTARSGGDPRRDTAGNRLRILPSKPAYSSALARAHVPLRSEAESADTAGAALLLLQISASVGPAAAREASGHAHPDVSANSPPKSAGRSVLDQLVGGIGERGRGLLMLNLLVLLWATNWSIVKTGGQAMDPLIFSSLRFGIAGLVFLPWLPKALKDKEVMAIGMELGVLNFLGYGTQAISLGMTTASKASFLSTFAVLVVPMMACLNGRSVCFKTILAGMGTMAGVALLEESGGPDSINMGDAWALFSALMFGLQIYRTEVHSRRLSGPEKHLPMASATMTMLAFLSVCSLAATHPGQAAHILTMSPQAMQYSLSSVSASLDNLDPFVVGSVLYTGLATTAMPMWLEITALQDVEASDCAVIYAMEPLLGASIAWLTLGERWGSIGWVGAALILASNLSVQLCGDDHHPTAEEADN